MKRAGLFALPAAWPAARGPQAGHRGWHGADRGGDTVHAGGPHHGPGAPRAAGGGRGNAAHSALTWPLLTMLVPPERVGVFAGLKTSAEAISALFTAEVAPSDAC